MPNEFNHIVLVVHTYIVQERENLEVTQFSGITFTKEVHVHVQPVKA